MTGVRMTECCSDAAAAAGKQAPQAVFAHVDSLMHRICMEYCRWSSAVHEQVQCVNVIARVDEEHRTVGIADGVEGN